MSDELSDQDVDVLARWTEMRRELEEKSMHFDWGLLAWLEPRLEGLERRVQAIARSASSGRTFCNMRAWRGYPDGPSPRRDVIALIGWARDPEPQPPQTGPIRRVPIQDLMSRQAKRLQARLDDDRAERLLRSSKAYDVAYRHLYNMIPPCRGCACVEDE